jgi:hypothetical protein
MTLLYRLAEWHALAKLRMHTDSTLTRMDSVTTQLGHELRTFSDSTCATFQTVELPKEAAARIRRRARAQTKKGAESSASVAPPPTSTSDGIMALSPTLEPSGMPEPTTAVTNTALPAKERKKKKFNISTYKFHALGDYVRTIRMFGTTDSYSTQTVSEVTFFVCIV